MNKKIVTFIEITRICKKFLPYLPNLAASREIYLLTLFSSNRTVYSLLENIEDEKT